MKVAGVFFVSFFSTRGPRQERTALGFLILVFTSLWSREAGLLPLSYRPLTKLSMSHDKSRKVNFNVSDQYEILDVIGEGAYGVVW